MAGQWQENGWDRAGDRVKAEKMMRSYLLADMPTWFQVFVLPLALFDK